MTTSKLTPIVSILAIVAVSLTPAAFGATTMIDVKLGDSFTGSIGTAGVDTVEARFHAVKGASVRVTLQVDHGSTLRPTIAINDSSGAPIGGATQQIAWLPSTNLIHYATIPDAGMYTVVIGASAGSGSFWAQIIGSPSTAPVASVSGTVTDALTGEGIEDVDVLLGEMLFAVTDAKGSYSGDVAAGSYAVTFQADGYETETRSLNAVVGSGVVLNVALTPLVPVTLDASVSGDAVPGGSLIATVDIQAPPGTTIDSITWSQVQGVDVGLGGVDGDGQPVTLGSESAYRDQLIHHVSEPPVTQEELPENVQLPEEGAFGGLQNRLQVVGVNPFSLEETALVVLEVEVVTSLGTFTEEVEIHTELPWKVATGLRNVPIGHAVLLHAPEQGAYEWTLTPPPGSSATLTDPTSRNPYFTPDVPGQYDLDVAEPLGDALADLEIFAGTWRGVIVDQDMDGRPVSDAACTTCHNDTIAVDKFDDWAQTGHAEIFTNNLNTSSYYNSSCFPCHSVGYDPDVENGGFDEAEDYADFLASGLLGSPGDNWTTVLEDFPETARLAQAQCENCHGPQDSIAHGFAPPAGEPRVSLSADVCATCHGEPLRHARFQQWQLSPHANFELTREEGDSGSCARCHSGNGFLDWLPILLGEAPGDPTASLFSCGSSDICVGGTKDGQPCTENIDCASWTLDDIQPQTCATCHDPHAPGTTSGIGTNATVRISGDTPPLIAGFTATDVGRGAICITCHNSRRGLYNDEVFEELSASDRTRAPHGSAQGDVLMGENAFFVEVGARGGHSRTEDACVSCHMEATPPPDVLSYNLGGTNHTFFADRNICSECHSPHMKADDVQAGIQFLLDQVQDLIEDALIELMDEVISLGYYLDLEGDTTITDVSEVVSLEFTETRGRQAFSVTFADARGTMGPFRVSSTDVLEPADPDPIDRGNLYDFADDALKKAGWNWNLFMNDGSTGIHNPLFASDALAAARDALVSASPGLDVLDATAWSFEPIATHVPETIGGRDPVTTVIEEEEEVEAGTTVNDPPSTQIEQDKKALVTDPAKRRRR